MYLSFSHARAHTVGFSLTTQSFGPGGMLELPAPGAWQARPHAACGVATCRLRPREPAIFWPFLGVKP